MDFLINVVSSGEVVVGRSYLSCGDVVVMDLLL